MDGPKVVIIIENFNFELLNGNIHQVIIKYTLLPVGLFLLQWFDWSQLGYAVCCSWL